MSFQRHNNLPHKHLSFRMTAALLIGASLVAGCGGSDSEPDALLQIAKAKCGTGDRAETGVQGQVPVAERAAGFKGFNCNLQKSGNVTVTARGEPSWQQFAFVRDRSGRLCGFGGGAFNQFQGTVVVDLGDPSKPTETTVLKTSAMLNPGEGLRVHAERGLLASAYYNTTPGTKEESHGFDIYDVGTDCRHPQLLATSTTIAFPTSGLLPPATGAWPANDTIYGHEGAFAPDGLTYYVSDTAHGVYHAIDLTDPTKPKLLSSFRNPTVRDPSRGGGPHGLSVSNNGNRAYVVASAYNPTAAGGMVPQTGEWHDGFLVVDTSEVQSRKAGATMRLVSQALVKDNSAMQMTIPVQINNKPYVIALGEGGTGQFNRAGLKAACAAGLTPFSMPQIFDMSDETKPTVINKVRLEANDPKNCSAIMPEIDTLNGFIYDVHMCSVDNRDNATTMACSFFGSGVRVFDIRNPANIKEIAYWVPPAKGAAPAWCGALPFLDATTNSLYSTCADTGIFALKFSNQAWPFATSTTPKDRQL